MSEHIQRVILIPQSREKDPEPSDAKSPGFFASLRMTVSWALTLPARAASGLIWLYQRTLSPALVVLNPTCGCRFAPTCSHYAREALREHGLLAGLGLTLVRLAKCGPWHPGGDDPVPPRTCRRIVNHPQFSPRRSSQSVGGSPS